METVMLRSLKKILPKKYKHRHLIACEISSVVYQYTSLKPVMDTYVFNDGSSEYLMCLTGTIPVCHKGVEYKIPLSLWLLDSYPLHPPMCYVQAAKGKMIVRSENINVDGKVDIPYLHDWKPPLSDLYGLVQVIRVMFGEKLPLCKQDPKLESPEPLSSEFLSLPLSQTQTEGHWSVDGGAQVTLSSKDFEPLNESKC